MISNFYIEYLIFDIYYSINSGLAISFIIYKFVDYNRCLFCFTLMHQTDVPDDPGTKSSLCLQFIVRYNSSRRAIAGIQPQKSSTIYFSEHYSGGFGHPTILSVRPSSSVTSTYFGLFWIANTAFDINRNLPI